MANICTFLFHRTEKHKYEQRDLIIIQGEIVTIKFNEPIIDEIPDIRREKIAKSTEAEE